MICDTSGVPEISRRLLLRIEADFPHHTDTVIDRLHSLDGVVAASRQDDERMFAAVLRLAGGRLDRLDHAVALACSDWRDLLAAAGLAAADWPVVLAEWLGPGSAPGSAPGPVATGELVEADGHRWRLRRRRLDLRLVKRLLHRPEVVVLLCEPEAGSPRRVPVQERGQLWDQAQRAYAGPGACGHPVDGPEYLGHEFTDGDGQTLLYLEARR